MQKHELYQNYHLQLLQGTLPYVCVYFVCVCPQVQTLIEQEVSAVGKKNETKLRGLLETIQQLDREVNYESAIQKLEVGGSSGTHTFLTH